MMTNNITAKVNFGILNEIARINPGCAALNMGKVAKDMAALMIIDSFLEAQAARLANYCPYKSHNGTTAAIDRDLAGRLASTLIAIA